jgi:hypothetical protein
LRSGDLRSVRITHVRRAKAALNDKHTAITVKLIAVASPSPIAFHGLGQGKGKQAATSAKMRKSGMLIVYGTVQVLAIRGGRNPEVKGTGDRKLKPEDRRNE